MDKVLQLQAPWEQVREKLKEINIELTDEDLHYEPGKEKELLNRLQKKMHKSHEEIKGLIESVSANKGKAS
ncbi:MAG: general stress protein CsbD [Chitinophagaceae bacterium]|nr:general stress protein CsbD [Chitinophagaceae bacterium]